VTFHMISTGWGVFNLNFNRPAAAQRPTVIRAVYPADTDGEPADVVLAFEIDENGIPINFHTQHASDPKWESIAIAIVSDWQFLPARKDGRVIPAPCLLELRRGETPPHSPAAEFPPPAAGVMRIRIGGNVQAANLVTKVTPPYPLLAKEAQIQGTVRFSVVIGTGGSIERIHLVSGHPVLVPAATDAVKQWTYRPTLLNGEPVEVLTQVDVNFTLSN
jgi:TonB family protein